MILEKTYTLALDCAVKNISLALIQGGKIISSYNEIPDQPQSAVLMKIFDDVLKKAKVVLSQIDSVLYCHGPGSFTSLRVGLATLKGLFLRQQIHYF